MKEIKDKLKKLVNKLEEKAINEDYEDLLLEIHKIKKLLEKL